MNMPVPVLSTLAPTSIWRMAALSRTIRVAEV
jgi:hypothetical protein